GEERDPHVEATRDLEGFGRAQLEPAEEMAHGELPSPAVDRVHDLRVPGVADLQVEGQAAEIDEQPLVRPTHIMMEAARGRSGPFVPAPHPCAVDLRAWRRENEAALVLVVRIAHGHEDAGTREHNVTRLVVETER